VDGPQQHHSHGGEDRLSRQPRPESQHPGGCADHEEPDEGHRDDERFVLVPQVGDHELDDRARCQADDALRDRLHGRDPEVCETVQQLGDRESCARGDDTGDGAAPVFPGQPHASILPHDQPKPERTDHIQRDLHTFVRSGGLLT